MMEEIERLIIEQLNRTDSLTKEEFSMLAESIIDYIDNIGRTKK